MANNFTSNPMQIDTASAGTLFAGISAKNLAGIIVIASADAWSIVLHNRSGGDVIFRADSSIANHRSVYWAPARPIVINGVFVTTLTNITICLVYLSGEE